MIYFPVFLCFSRVGRRVDRAWAGWLLTTTMDGVMGLWGYGDAVAFLFLGWDGMDKGRVGD